MATTKGIDWITKDLWQMIFAYVPVPQRIAIECVCKKWREALDEKYWKVQASLEFPQMVASFPAVSVPQNDFYKRLMYSYFSNPTDSNLLKGNVNITKQSLPLFPLIFIPCGNKGIFFGERKCGPQDNAPTLRIHDMDTNASLSVIDGVESSPSPEANKTLLTFLDGDGVQLYDFNTEFQATLCKKNENERILALQLSANNDHFLLKSNKDSQCLILEKRVLSDSQVKCVTIEIDTDSDYTDCAMNESNFVITFDNGKIFIVNPNTLEIRLFTTPFDSIKLVHLSRNYAFLLDASYQKVCIFNLKTKMCYLWDMAFKQKTHEVVSITKDNFASVGNVLFYFGSDHILQAFDLANNLKVPIKEEIKVFLITAQGSRLYCLKADQSMVIWDLNTSAQQKYVPLFEKERLENYQGVRSVREASSNSKLMNIGVFSFFIKSINTGSGLKECLNLLVNALDEKTLNVFSDIIFEEKDSYIKELGIDFQNIYDVPEFLSLEAWTDCAQKTIVRLNELPKKSARRELFVTPEMLTHLSDEEKINKAVNYFSLQNGLTACTYFNAISLEVQQAIFDILLQNNFEVFVKANKFEDHYARKAFFSEEGYEGLISDEERIMAITAYLSSLGSVKPGKEEMK